MRARPFNYVAQEFVRLSCAPVWDKSAPRGLLARSIGLRVYACATPDGYIAMPGGLTRTASGPDERVISIQRGGGSKDTWVLARGPVGSFSLLRQAVGPQDLVRTGINLSSRVTEHLFWFGRYSARGQSRVAAAPDDRAFDRRCSGRNRSRLAGHPQSLPPTRADRKTVR